MEVVELLSKDCPPVCEVWTLGGDVPATDTVITKEFLRHARRAQ